MKLRHFIIGISILFVYSKGYSQTKFSDFEGFLNYASSKSISEKKGEIELSQAKQARLAALLGVLDPSGSTSLSYKNNLKLPVTLVPSQLLGGKAGEYERVQFGLQYETQFNFNGELKLLNMAGWQGLNLSKTNILLSESQRKLNRKQLYDNIAPIYYNIVTLKAQKATAEQHLLLADTIRQNVQLLFQKGLANQQNVSESQVNYLKLVQSVEQVDYLIQQQYIALKILCDLPESDSFVIDETIKNNTESISVETNETLLETTKLRQEMALLSFKKAKADFLPSVSLFFSSSQQQFNNSARLFDKSVNWIPSSYLGLRIHLPLPNSQMIAQKFKNQYEYLLAKEDHKKNQINTNNQVIQLNIEYRKARAKAISNQEIVSLKEEIYLKNTLNYQSGIISLNTLLESFQAKLDAEYEYRASQAAVQLAIQKINIHNSIK